jgi:hypothetical protein
MTRKPFKYGRINRNWKVVIIRQKITSTFLKLVKVLHQEITFFCIAHGITARIRLFTALQLTPDDVTLRLAATITRMLLYHKLSKKPLYNLWDTRIKMLNKYMDSRVNSFKALKLVWKFIKDWIS